MTGLLPDNIPDALTTHYPDGEPNQPIILYEGTLEILQGGNVKKGKGTVHLVWFPYPRVEFKLSSHDSFGMNTGEASLKLPELEEPVEVHISSSRFHESRIKPEDCSAQLSGQPKVPIVIGSGHPLKYMQFHLTNFWDFVGPGTSVIKQGSGFFLTQRVVFEAEGWKITIDQLKTTKKNVESLEEQGGYAITHVGRLEQSNGTTFQADEARNFLEVLSQFLSFVRGFWTSPILLVGYDSCNDPVWKEWSQSNSDPWQKVYPWAWKLHAKHFASLFPGFVTWWQDWEESAELAIHWYIESNKQAGRIEGSLILSQTALELCAWVFLVDKGKVFSADTFDNENNSASKKINRLLERQNIPGEIPCHLANLIQFGSKLKHSKKNGPYAIAELRNSITHSAPNNREMLSSTSKEERAEAWELSLWYIELVILSLCKYQGSYFNRLPGGKRWQGDTELVPWKGENS